MYPQFLIVWGAVILPLCLCEYIYEYAQSVQVTAAWKSTAVDDSGTYLYSAGTGIVYRSTNGGASSSSIQPAGSSTSSYDWTVVSVSATGQYVAVGATAQGVWVSTNYGSTWKNEIGASGYVFTLLFNPTGQYLAAVGQSMSSTCIDSAL